MSDEIKISVSDEIMYQRIEESVLSLQEVCSFTSDGFQDIMQEITFAFKKRPPKGIFLRHTKRGIYIDVSVALIYDCDISSIGKIIQNKIHDIVSELTTEPILSIDVAVTEIIK